ncbi:unnamed protein product, partial [marine sediment metagenome]
AEQYTRKRSAYEAAMERHASVPDGDYFQRMLQVKTEIVKLVEEDIPKTCSDNEAKGRKEYQVLK